MGCIETRLIFRHRLPVQGLTLTWDVLKPNFDTWVSFAVRD